MRQLSTIAAAITLVFSAACGGDTTGPVYRGTKTMSIAGTFEFTLAREGATPAARAVTSGAFDVRY
jgi:hypothetical protein